MASTFLTLLRLIWFTGLVAVVAPGRAHTEAFFVLRELPPQQRYTLRVLYVEDPRLPTLDAAQRQSLYRKLEQLTRGWLGYEVQLREVRREKLAAYFAAQEAVFQRHEETLRAITLDPADSADRAKLRDAIAHDFRARDLALIARYLRVEQLASQAAAVELARRQFLARLEEIQAIPVSDGARLVEKAAARLNSYPHWDALLSEIEEADVVLTNTIVAGADTTMPIYVIARGGVTTAITNNNVRSPLQAAMMVGLFPFLSDAPIFLRERGRIPETELLDVIATLCLHELGHLLRRYAEYYDHPNCVHVAPPGLDYYRWHLAVRKAGPCPLPHRTLQRF